MLYDQKIQSLLDQGRGKGEGAVSCPAAVVLGRWTLQAKGLAAVASRHLRRTRSASA